MLVGYARTSTLEQKAGFEAQLKELKDLNCQKVFSEQTSSIAFRAQLQEALEFVREGDSLVVTKLDRLARNVIHLGEILKILNDKKVHLRILNLGIDTSHATGQLVLNIMGAISAWEIAMMRERQLEGIAKAKADGKYRGRQPTVMKRANEVLKLHSEGVTPTEIARQLKVARSSVYRVLDLQKAA